MNSQVPNQNLNTNQPLNSQQPSNQNHQIPNQPQPPDLNNTNQNVPKKNDGLFIAGIILTIILSLFLILLRYYGYTIHQNPDGCSENCQIVFVPYFLLVLIPIVFFGIDYKKHPTATIIGIVTVILLNPYIIDFIWDILNLPDKLPWYR